MNSFGICGITLFRKHTFTVKKDSTEPILSGHIGKAKFTQYQNPLRYVIQISEYKNTVITSGLAVLIVVHGLLSPNDSENP